MCLIYQRFTMQNLPVFKELKRIIRAFGYSFEGLRAAWGEPAFRTELLVAIVAIPAGIYLGQDGISRALLVGSVFLVLMVELLNTGIEDAINRVSTEIHPLSKRAKDVASAAVLLSIVNAFVVWLLVLWN